MKWSPRYLETSLYYEPWKTKFIEVFIREFYLLKKEYISLDKANIETYTKFIEHFIDIFKLSLQILKKMFYLNGKNCIFYSDVIKEAVYAQILNDKKLCLQAVLFVESFYHDKQIYTKFNPEFLQILNGFYLSMLPLIKKEGFRDKNYVFYDNSYCLWGIKEKYYRKMIRLFLKHENLKIVRICGSRVTNKYREFSDIDLISEGTYSQKEYFQIKNAILEMESPYIIDMNDIYKKSKPFIYRNTIRSNIFYKRSDYVPENYVSII